MPTADSLAIVMVSTRQRRRIGDHAAATMVVRDVRGLTPAGA